VQYVKNGANYRSPVPGVEQKTLVYGEKTLMVEFRLRAGSVIPSHRHPHEQTGYLVSGALRLTIAEDTTEFREGDAWCIAPDVAHSAEALEDAVAIEVFSPVREDYLPE
jgi:quercetin dioxygenase-like cupin family protein